LAGIAGRAVPTAATLASIERSEAGLADDSPDDARHCILHENAILVESVITLHNPTIAMGRAAKEAVKLIFAWDKLAAIRPCGFKTVQSLHHGVLCTGCRKV
jgi:hypothetical protein